MDKYFDLIERRVQGKLMTAAAFLRKFAMAHDDYKQDSILTHSIVYDLVEVVTQINRGTLHVPQLLDKPSDLPADPQIEKDRGPYLAGRMNLSQPQKPSQNLKELKLPNSKGCAVFRAFLEKNCRRSRQKSNDLSKSLLSTPTSQESIKLPKNTNNITQIITST